MNRLATALIWLASLAAAGYLGYVLGRDSVPLAEHPGSVSLPAVAAQASTAVQQPDPADGAGSELQALIEAGKFFDALAVVEEAIARHPADVGLRFIQAELLHKTRQPVAAINQLLAIRSMSLSNSEMATARQRIDDIINHTNLDFRARNSAAEAIKFFEDILVLEPSYDRHRLHLAEWLIVSDDLQTAQRLVSETGLNGVSQAQLDQVQRSLQQHASTLPVQRRAGGVFADIFVSTRHQVARLHMVLDTGATLTAIALPKLRELGARRTSHTVNARTANGNVELPIYELDSLEAGPLTLHNVKVAALSTDLNQADGLLGMDVLDQLPVPVITE